MECAPSQLWAAERLGELFDRASLDRVPFMVSLDITYRCDLRCTHCYAGHRVAETREEAAELATEEVLSLLEQVASAGCLHLLLSGGEPLLHPDFTIYTAARRLGMLVTVFTNATLIGDAHLDLFADYRPQKVDVSLYGATPATYERVTGVPGSYTRAIDGIEGLVGRGIPVGLKTMILRENVDEVGAMEALASRLGVGFRADPLITLRQDGDLAPTTHRVEARRAVALELADSERRDALRDYAEERRGLSGSRRLYRCGAGMMSYHLDPQGIMRPCLESRKPTFDAVSMGIESAWRALVDAVDGLQAAPDDKCATCPLMVLCGYCPALSGLESGSDSRDSEYVCSLGEARAQAIGWANPMGAAENGF